MEEESLKVENSTSHPGLNSSQLEPFHNSIDSVTDDSRSKDRVIGCNSSPERLISCILFPATEHDTLINNIELESENLPSYGAAARINPRLENMNTDSKPETLNETYIHIPSSDSGISDELLDQNLQENPSPKEVDFWYSLVRLVWLYSALYAGISPSNDSIWLLTLTSIFEVGLFYVPTGPVLKFENVLYALYSIVWLCVVGFASGALLRWTLLELWIINDSVVGYIRS